MPPKAATSPAEPVNLALTDAAARQLANATKTTAQLDTITPRWLVRLLHWTPVEAGIYRWVPASVWRDRSSIFLTQ